MPIYQYTCESCGNDFEKKLRMSQSGEAQDCPDCGSHETRKRLGAISIGGVSRSSSVATRPPSSPFT